VLTSTAEKAAVEGLSAGLEVLVFVLVMRLLGAIVQIHIEPVFRGDGAHHREASSVKKLMRFAILPPHHSRRSVNLDGDLPALSAEANGWSHGSRRRCLSGEAVRKPTEIQLDERSEGDLVVVARGELEGDVPIIGGDGTANAAPIYAAVPNRMPEQHSGGLLQVWIDHAVVARDQIAELIRRLSSYE